MIGSPISWSTTDVTPVLAYAANNAAASADGTAVLNRMYIMYLDQDRRAKEKDALDEATRIELERELEQAEKKLTASARFVKGKSRSNALTHSVLTNSLQPSCSIP